MSYLICYNIKETTGIVFPPAFIKVNHNTPIPYIIGSLKVATPWRILILSDETTMSSQQSSKVPIDDVITILLLYYWKTFPLFQISLRIHNSIYR